MKITEIYNDYLIHLQRVIQELEQVKREALEEASEYGYSYKWGKAEETELQSLKERYEHDCKRK